MMNERERRWRLILGKDEDQEQQQQDSQNGQQGSNNDLSQDDQQLDDTLDALYGDEGGLDDAAPEISRWLENVRDQFSQPVVQVMQRDLVERSNLRKLIRSPELLADLEPDLDMATQLLQLKRHIPEKARQAAREYVAALVADIQERLEHPLRAAIQGSLNRAAKSRRPKHKDINWQRTIYKNLKHYQPTHKTIVAEQLVGFGKRQQSLKDIILCIDQSGSMAKSAVYASIFGAVMASLTSLSTRLVAFSTAIADLTEHLHDPVGALFGMQLRGGTNIDRALAYCETHITRPTDTILILISDLFEGGNAESMLARIAQLQASGVQVIVLLALNDDGAPRFERDHAATIASYGVPAFACTPDQFPELVAAAINGRDINLWAASEGIVTAPRN